MKEWQMDNTNVIPMDNINVIPAKVVTELGWAGIQVPD